MKRVRGCDGGEPSEVGFSGVEWLHALTSLALVLLGAAAVLGLAYWLLPRL